MSLWETEQFKWAVEASPTGMLIVDRAGRIVLVNAQAEALFGYTRDELLGQPLEMLVPARFRNAHPDFRVAFLASPRARPMGAGRELFGLRKNGTEVPIEIGLNPLETPDGTFILSSVVDVTERKRGEQERDALLAQLRGRTEDLSATLKEREVLLQEVHHRVKNNLQVISSLISLQIRRLDVGSPRDALEGCQTRVQAIALIHEQLYGSKDYSRIQVGVYVRRLAGTIMQAMALGPPAFDLVVEAEDVTLPVDKAIPCGLILNELLSNAFKHAFHGDRGGTVRVTLCGAGMPVVTLRVADTGVGVPPGLDPRAARSMGLRLVSTLVDQLDGHLEIRRDGGTAFQIEFPVDGRA